MEGRGGKKGREKGEEVERGERRGDREGEEKRKLWLLVGCSSGVMLMIIQ